MRGIKKIEYRSRGTKVCGRIWICASEGRYAQDVEEEMMAEYGITDVSCDDLLRGVIVGSVDLYNCDGGEWYLRNPQRLEVHLKPKNHPMPVWFYPFGPEQ